MTIKPIKMALLILSSSLSFLLTNIPYQEEAILLLKGINNYVIKVNLLLTNESGASEKIRHI
ncbi:hypothetical protein MM221_09905 [Salipaludibacillus sp. LMS25]|jgi:hypothetical protein|uniref:hypothetical protein n=1 Tax=Salipaludibacillus sp. LMS25 TaxID=2924031 RepID=UPI0020D1A945|nr:hypothetical protein [Salipaludibacillus sp. LMS25]UTR16795.1 hypothetical protein MM221_09905 [Salipaludibacillus sp. LMS25]